MFPAPPFRIVLLPLHRTDSPKHPSDLVPILDEQELSKCSRLAGSCSHPSDWIRDPIISSILTSPSRFAFTCHITVSDKQRQTAPTGSAHFIIIPAFDVCFAHQSLLSLHNSYLLARPYKPAGEG
ncbi:hypothetical protein B0I35DRAFT_242143 [Stachybotrys elegans]|uniref:Uncharacterized protein n=1 Tax=Stachybotrys elegans TaxID=80388 RepID=A0A8K0WQI8_9HYPO|nr:hypothetical protein B0I35DRAFT_242143 [Stachybotrys elegans]